MEPGSLMLTNKSPSIIPIPSLILPIIGIDAYLFKIILIFINFEVRDI